MSVRAVTTEIAKNIYCVLYVCICCLRSNKQWL